MRESDLMPMRSLTRIRAAAYSIMLVFAGVLAMPLPTYAQGDASAGEKIFAHCAPCHSNKPGENKFGPSLAGVFGRKSGTEPGYNYSSAMKGANVTWDEKTVRNQRGVDQRRVNPAQRCDVGGPIPGAS